MKFDVIVVGGGHAGCEAALAPARMGQKTLLITGNLNYVASMPCNPSIGGPAKGIVVREIDALGGEMAVNADMTAIQMKLLNHSKGPAVQALRAQSDKTAYSKRMLSVLQKQKNLTLQENYVDSLIIDNSKVTGVVLENGEVVYGKKTIITTGTYLNSLVLVGSKRIVTGPDNQKPAMGLSPQLKELGFNLFRLKTGTPPRIVTSTINFDKTAIHPGDDKVLNFSYRSNYKYNPEEQVPCYLTYTSPLTHEIIENNLHLSAMYSGVIEGVGPRYCPSIEDKLVRFKDKERHQIFLEPETLDFSETYVQGFSTSMPEEVQQKMINSIPGLENAVIAKYAYAIEYDAIDARQLWPSLESKLVENLYFAGQINGTSGYEEAAGQGLIAGINAGLANQSREPLVLKRNEAYIGVLIDDLVTKGTIEPYRLLTSRAEYRLLLRHDNADQRLLKYGFDVGLITKESLNLYQDKMSKINRVKQLLKETFVYPNKQTNTKLKEAFLSVIKDKSSLYDLVKRPDYSVKKINSIYFNIDLDEEVCTQVDIEVKYEGYIIKATNQANKMMQMESVKIPKDIDYSSIKNLANEAKDKLSKIRPKTIGQASRVSGVNPSDISILLVYIEAQK